MFDKHHEWFSIDGYVYALTQDGRVIDATGRQLQDDEPLTRTVLQEIMRVRKAA